MNLLELPNCITLLILICLALFLTGCSKQSLSPDALASRHAAKPNVTDLGVVEISDKVSSRHEVGTGRTAVLTPTVLPDGTLDIAIVIEEPPVNSRRKLLAMPRVITKPGQAVEISVDELGLKFTPTLKGK